jgi:hypothetical protein
LVVGGAELGPRVAPAILAAKPLTVEQVRTGELRAHACSAEVLDRVAEASLGATAFGQEGS